MNRALELFRQYRYELIAVADGAIVMMLEMVGSRFVAPYLGTSTYVWTAIIGVILGALAVGNWYGGRLADRSASHDVLVRVFVIASSLLLLELIAQSYVLAAISGSTLDPRAQAFLAALLLFAPASAFMGMVSPYLAKLRLTSLEHAGQSVGTLYAAGTAGSIMGTFAAGYWLIGVIGSRTLGWSLVIVLVAVSYAVQYRGYGLVRASLIVVTILAALFVPHASPSGSFAGLRLLYDGDSSYARYQVLAGQGRSESVHYLITDNQSSQSGINLQEPKKPVFAYVRNFVDAARVLPDSPKRILMIGGGSLTLPSILANKYPETAIDVIEIDPALTAIAKNYFSYSSPPNIRIINQDGRYFLNHNTSKYDLVYMDAFTAVTPPFQLTTRETSVRLLDALGAHGLLVVNLVGPMEGSASAFAKASFATYSSVFRNVEWFRVAPDVGLAVRQNVTLIATQDTTLLANINNKVSWTRFPAPTVAARSVLTDDFAPVEILTSRH